MRFKDDFKPDREDLLAFIALAIILIVGCGLAIMFDN